MLALLLAVLALALSAGLAGAQESTDERLEALEEQIAALRSAISELAAKPPDERVAELERQVEVLTEEIEDLRLGETTAQSAEDEEGLYGLGIAASKVYRVGEGLSIGGYGEMVFESYASERESGEPTGFGDVIDFLRAVVYVGYKFDDRWVFNSEIEFEHASTSKSGSASVEFAYVDYLWKPQLNFRTGILLLPMGWLNELHEPTLFPSAERPYVEQVLIPSTWRENGAGIFGDVGPFSYRSYVVNGLKGASFTSNGLRGGRQKGAKAQARTSPGRGGGRHPFERRPWHCRQQFDRRTARRSLSRTGLRCSRPPRQPRFAVALRSCRVHRHTGPRSGRVREGPDLRPGDPDLGRCLAADRSARLQGRLSGLDQPRRHRVRRVEPGHGLSVLTTCPGSGNPGGAIGAAREPLRGPVIGSPDGTSPCGRRH